MKSDKRNDIASIERLTGKITMLTSEVKVLQSDQELRKIKFTIFLHFESFLQKMLIEL